MAVDKPGTPLEHTLTSIRIHRGHVATPQGHHRDESQHITRVLQSGELPVGAVTTAAHGPGDEGSSGERRPKDDGGESSAVSESRVTNIHQGVRECQGGETTAVSERFCTDRGEPTRECEGGETPAVSERFYTDHG